MVTTTLLYCDRLFVCEKQNKKLCCSFGLGCLVIPKNLHFSLRQSLCTGQQITLNWMNILDMFHQRHIKLRGSYKIATYKATYKIAWNCVSLAVNGAQCLFTCSEWCTVLIHLQWRVHSVLFLFYVLKFTYQGPLPPVYKKKLFPVFRLDKNSWYIQLTHEFDVSVVKSTSVAFVVDSACTRTTDTKY